MATWRINKLRQRACCSLTVLCLLLVAVCVRNAEPAEALYPLAGPDTSCPRATLKSFLDEMNDAVAAYKAGQPDHFLASLNLAQRCLNLDGEPEAIRPVVGLYTAGYLKETLDRIEMQPLQDIPDAKTVETQKLASWTLPHTKITIEVAKDGPARGEFLFSPDTVKRSQEFYKKVRNMPYRPGAEGALFDQLTSTVGINVIPKEVMDRLPGWSRAEIFGQTLWQSIGLILYFLVGVCVVMLIYKSVRKALGILDARFNTGLSYSLGGLVLPVTLILFAEMSLWFVVYFLHLRDADLYSTIAYVFLFISYGGSIWLIGCILSRAAAVVIAVGRFEPTSMHAPLIRFGFDVATVVIVLGAAIRLGARLGLPTYSLVTGLGIGGAAVALAGRETLSNLIGTIAILLDQPFKMGDFIVIGEGDSGTVTEIGLRSTRIRRLDGILVSVPNSNLANMKITNESAPVAQAQISVPVGVAYGSCLTEVEQALLTVSQRCDYVVPKPAPSVRLLRFGDSALEFALLVWISQPEFRARATDRINRAILEEFEKRRIRMPCSKSEICIGEEKWGSSMK